MIVICFWEYKNIDNNTREKYRIKRDKLIVSSTKEKKIKCIYKDTKDEFIFDSVEKCASYLNISQSYVTMSCQGKRGKLNNYKLY